MGVAVTQRGPVMRAVQAPPEALRRLAYADPQAFPVLLDSSATGPLGRYSILAAYPQGALWLDSHGRLHAEGSVRLGSAVAVAGEGQDRAAPAPAGFLSTLQALWRSEAGAVAVAEADAAVETDADAGADAGADATIGPAADAGAAQGGAGAAQGGAGAAGPFQGGWMVFLGYEIAGEIEPQLRGWLPAPHGAAESAPMALALRIPAAVLFDHVTGRAWLVAEAGREQLIADLQVALAGVGRAADIAGMQPGSAQLPGPLQLTEEPPERYRACIERALEHIRAGDIYQANLSRAWRGQLAARLSSGALAASLYERLRTANPAPFAALAHHRGWRLLCSSPERLVRVAGGWVDTRPIAGTRPRSRRLGQDAREIAALIANPKERAEHVMLVDLERNDLGRICRPGSVRADPMMMTESYAHVHHIVSNVSGRLRAGMTPLEVLRAVFPGGTITGCPKFRCMQIIAELEAEARGAYTGAIGFINHDGSMDFNILIRSLTLADGQLEFRAGAGIVADSDWRRELAETRAKARGLLAALQLPAPA